MITTEIQGVAAVAAALVGFLALNLGGVSLLLTWHDQRVRSRLESLDAEMLRVAGLTTLLQTKLTETELKLARDYVQREDWVRMVSVVDAKLDRLRESISELAESVAALSARGGES